MHSAASANNDSGAARRAGLYQAGVRNTYFGARALAPWMLNAAFQAGCMVAMVLAATAPTMAARADGSTWSHWEVCYDTFTDNIGSTETTLLTGN